jgi:tetratricopeptide (TPR) repeat protein
MLPISIKRPSATLTGFKTGVFKKAVELNPGYVTALINLGLVYTQRGELEKGIKQFQLAVQIDPNNAEAHNNLGSFYLGQGKYDQAMLELKKALDMRPDHQETMINLGMLHMSINDYERAEQLFRKVLEIDKNSAEGHSQLGYLYLLREEFDKALSHYQEMLRLQTDAPKGYYYMGKDSEPMIINSMLRDNQADGSANAVYLLESVPVVSDYSDMQLVNYGKDDWLAAITSHIPDKGTQNYTIMAGILTAVGD